MYNNNNFVLSEDVLFQEKHPANINSISNYAESSMEISIPKVKEILTKNLLTPRELIQVLSNLEALIEAIKIFKQ